MSFRKLLLGASLIAAAHVASAQTPPTPLFPGTLADVKTINTANLLNAMNAGNGQFVAVAAHRGYWEDVPENSIPAIQAAYNNGLEAVEIDVRLATPTPTSGAGNLTTSTPFSLGMPYGQLKDTENGGLVLSHDECIDRETSKLPGTAGTGGTGSTRWHYNKSKCVNDTGYNVNAYTALLLRDRKGQLSAYHPPTFAQALTALQSYLSVDANGVLHGPVMIVDLKDKDDLPKLNNGDNLCQECIAWNEYVYGLSIMRATLPQAMWPAVIWKLKMTATLPSPAAVASEISQHPTYGTLILTINPEDVNNVDYGPTASSFLTLLGYANSPANTERYVNQFEYVPFNAEDGSELYLFAGLTTHMPVLTSFATYYQPSFYPEGVATRYGGCCYIAPINVAENIASTDTTKNALTQATVDTRGTLDFATYYMDPSYPASVGQTGAIHPKTALITSDNLLETLNYLVVQNYRKLSVIQ